MLLMATAANAPNARQTSWGVHAARRAFGGCAAALITAGFAPAFAHATTVTVDNEHLMLSADTFVSSGGTGRSGVRVSHETPNPNDPSNPGPIDRSQLFIQWAAIAGQGAPESLQLAPGAGPYCGAVTFPASSVLSHVACKLSAPNQFDGIDSIGANLGDGRDFVALAIDHLGDRTAANSTGFIEGYNIDVDLGAGDDTFQGGPLTEHVLDGLGADLIFTAAGADWIAQPSSASPATDDAGDMLQAGTDPGDLVQYDGEAVGGRPGVTVTLDGLGANDGVPGENDTVIASDVSGTDAADTLTGNDAGNDLYGFGGGDTIRGEDGNDSLHSEDGDFEAPPRDTGDSSLTGGPGNDALWGNGSDDTLDGGPGDDFVVGLPGNDIMTGGPGSDAFWGEQGDDSIDAADAANDAYVRCGPGVDTVSADTPPLDGNIEAPGAGGAGCESVNGGVRPPDTVPPVITFAVAPPASTNLTAATFTWSTDGISGDFWPRPHDCALDGVATDCFDQTVTLTGLTAGAHTFTVRTTDLAGNASAVATRTWTVGAAPPDDGVDPPVDTGTPGQGSGGATPPPPPPGPGTPSVPGSSRFTLPADARAKPDGKGRVSLTFSCASTAGCSAQVWTLKAKLARKTVTLIVAVKALAPGQRATVKAKLPKRLARAVRRAGRNGVKVSLKTAGQPAQRLTLTRKRGAATP